MTNILAAITFAVTTNWMTTSITRPANEDPLHAVIRYETAHQIGARITNTVATVVWKGTTNQFVLESTPAFYTGDLKQDVIHATGSSIVLP